VRGRREDDKKYEMDPHLSWWQYEGARR
jgi:hypothetical protein